MSEEDANIIIDPNTTTEGYKVRLIAASKKALEHLLTVIEEPILDDSKEDLTADRMKNAVMAKKIAIFDYLEILTRIDAEQVNISEPESKDKGHGFAEGRAN